VNGYIMFLKNEYLSESESQMNERRSVLVDQLLNCATYCMERNVS
jgi:hypothetical protein